MPSPAETVNIIRELFDKGDKEIPDMTGKFS
jgi:hypothetical protein